MTGPAGTTAPSAAPPARRTAPGGPSAPGRIPALDGLRGLAVVAVIVNHARPGWLRGGWLGVDVFFVLSGFLITSLLLGEHARTGRIDLGRFYSRRARRLLPALFLLLVAVAVVDRVAPGAPGFDGVRGDGLAALAYVANWHFVLSGTSYFAAFAPSPLRHLWSLSVEEQFYLVWPVTLLVLVRRRGVRAVAIGAFALAVSSAVAMALAYGGGAHTSRAYFGSDTHAHGVLLGCALAACFALAGPAARVPRSAAVGALALAGIALAAVRLDGSGAAAYRGGIAGAGLLTALLIACVAPGGRGPATWLLERTVLRGLGRISYGLYLWHWPVLQFVTAARTGLSGASLLGCQLLLTLLLAVASFVALERPVLAGWPRPRWSWIGVPATATATLVGLVAVVPAGTAPFAAAARDARERTVTASHLSATAIAHVAGAATRRVVVVGDSVAYTLFPGLRDNERASHLYFLTAAETGCPLDVAATAYEHEGEPRLTAGVPRSCDWPHLWPAMVRRTRPDLVVALWGLWDLYDHDVHGTWLRVGTASWSSYMEHTLEHAVSVLTATGARVVVCTPPYLIGVTNARVHALDAVYAAVVRRSHGLLTVLDLHPAMQALQPARWDGVHFTVAGADVLGRALDPVIARLARSARP